MTAEHVVSLLAALKEFLGQFQFGFRRQKTFDYLVKYVVGLMTDLPRKSIEPMALAADVPVRTLQEFLSQFVWDDERLRDHLQRQVADRYASTPAVGIIDASGHPKQGKKTPGVQRQYCGERGKIENCVVGQHLLYSDNDPANPFTCMLASDLYLPKIWAEDRPRCQEAGIPDELEYRPKWKIALGQLRRAVGNGVRFAHVLFDEDYGRVPAFWFGLDKLGLCGVGEVPGDFHAWIDPPRNKSLQAQHASRHVKNLSTHSPAFAGRPWQTVRCRQLTRGPARWRFKALRVHLVKHRHRSHRGFSVPTDRQYWLFVAENLDSGERKYIVSNATADANPAELLKVALERWQIEQWFGRSKQEAGLGAFEVRTYQSLMRHWLCSALAMFFLSSQTHRLRGEKSTDHSRAGGERNQRPGLGSLATPTPCPGGFA
jgi:SRSO17 transposase